MNENPGCLPELPKQSSSPREQRILAELRFAQSVSEARGGEFGDILEKAFRTALEAFRTGNTDDAAVAAAESILAPMAPACREYTILCAAHAHIDMNWMWSYDETVMTAADTFTTMLQIMEEFPEYKFSQSQASVYRIAEKYAPELLAGIRKYVKEGRWEVTASTWVEADKNMPTGESFARHALYTKQYLCGLLGISPDSLAIDFEPDTFGHSANIPEIDTQAGVKYYYHCRGSENSPLLSRWRSPSGAELIVYRDPFFYNGTIDSFLADSAVDLSRKTGMKTLLKVYGVGDHGGGPTRRDIRRILEMREWPIFPQIRFGTFAEYFAAAEAIREELPVQDKEINFICDGCYTSQSRIKAGNIRCERGLRAAEGFDALSAAFAGAESRSAMYREAWESVLFNQFHDIITGSGVAATRAYACGAYETVEAAVKSGTREALRALCAKIDTSGAAGGADAESTAAGAGVGSGQPEYGAGKTRLYHLFNSEAADFTGCAQVTVWDYEGDAARLRFRGSDGKDLPFQLLERSDFWGHDFAKYLVKADVPAFGYETVTAYEDPRTAPDFHYVDEMRRQYEEAFVLENEYLRAELDPVTASVVSLTDKTMGRQLLDPARGGAGLCVIDEANAKSITNWNSSMSAWFVGRHKTAERVSGGAEIVPGASGALRNSYRVHVKMRASTLDLEISLDAGSRDLDFSLKCDWREFGDTAEKIPSLAFAVPLCGGTEDYLYDVPFGAVKRAPMNIDRPGNSFAEAYSSAGRLMLVSDSRYGFRCCDDCITLKLLRSSTEPDPVPEIGIHETRFALSLRGENETADAAARFARAKYAAVPVLSGEPHKGSWPLRRSLMSVSGDAVVSAVKRAENDPRGITLRVYHPGETEERVRADFASPAVSAETTDVLERAVPGNAAVCGGGVEFTVPPFAVRTVTVCF